MDYSRDQMTGVDEIAVRVVAAAMTNATNLANMPEERRSQIFDQLAMIGYEVAEAVVRRRNMRHR